MMQEEGFLKERVFLKMPEGFEAEETKLEIVEAGNKKITLVKFRGEFFACAHLCPHAGGVLSGGRIDDKGNIVCPLHGYRFNLKNGRNSSGEGFHLKIFSLEKTAGGFWVEIR